MTLPSTASPHGRWASVTWKRLKELQDTNQFTELMVRQEELKTLPFGEVWDEYCRRNGVPVDGAWFEEVKKYEQNVLSKRI